MLKVKTLSFDKTSSQIFKGVGIILIVIHNYFNWMPPFGGANEFFYDPFLFDLFLYWVKNDTINSIDYFFTFFGHYGVQLFIFISGYGLTKLYFSKKTSYKSYILKRIFKLYPAFTIAILLLIIYQITFLDFKITERTIASIVIRYTLIANFIPGKIYTLSGPYWFLSMLFQLYLLFPVLVRLHKKHTYALLILTTLCYLIIILFNTYCSANDFSLYYNFLGNLPVFCLGIFIATTCIKRTQVYACSLVGVLIFCLGQCFEVLWYFSQISFVLIWIPIVLLLEKTKLASFLSYVGSLSLYIFLVHGFLRLPWTTFLEQSNNNNNNSRYAFLIIYICVTIFVSFLLKILTTQLVAYLKQNSKIFRTYA